VRSKADDMPSLI